MSQRSWRTVIAPGEAAEPGVTAKIELSPRNGRQTISQICDDQ